jgi:two-component sensor histidine kinase
MSNSNLKLRVREVSMQLESSENNLANRTRELKDSEHELIKLTLRLEASDQHFAELVEQLKVSEGDLTKSILQLKISQGDLTNATLQLKASDVEREVLDVEREDLISKLNKSLAGKTLLMRELHHRVKNNLAVIASLLAMQADMLTDERAVRALSDSQQRVMSMALIHQSLHGSNHLDKLNFGEYLEKLANQVPEAYAIEGDLVNVRVVAEDIDLPMHRVISCGLIVNELLSNALKYAYRRGDGGEISVQFMRMESGQLSLSCQDNGVGIPESFDWKHSSSLGLRIIQLLTEQLDGQLTLDRSRGTKFELRLYDSHQHAIKALPGSA